MRRRVIEHRKNFLSRTAKPCSTVGESITMSLKKEKSATTLPQQLESFEQRIAYTDEKINRLVYELYGLTEEEIKIVEGNGAAA